MMFVKPCTKKLCKLDGVKSLYPLVSKGIQSNPLDFLNVRAQWYTIFFSINGTVCSTFQTFALKESQVDRLEDYE
jgi:hypothetical protein